jgi:LacI family transcriptional regulator
MTKGAKGHVTLKHVAERAGVHPSTVSLVLTNKPVALTEETRQRVRRAAEELGYRGNALAAGLRRRTSDTIGFVSDLIATTPHAGQLIQGAQDAAWNVGKVLLIINTGGDEEVEQRAIAAMLARRVDGLVYAAMFHRHIEPSAALYEVPTVLLDARSDDTRLSSVAPDEEGGARAAVSRLLDAGHRRIGYLQSDASIPAARERLKGYRDTLEERGLGFDASLVVEAIDEHEGGTVAASAILDQIDRPTALFCFNDRMAVGAIHAAHAMGLSVPRDLSLVGYDNEELVAPLAEPPLTTVQLPHYEMGRWAVEELLATVSGASSGPRQHRMACLLVERESVAPPPTPYLA